MYRLIQFTLLGSLIGLLGCTSAATIGRSERVTLILTSGDKIKAEVMHIDRSYITFTATDKKKAFDFGEKLAVDRVEAIKLSDGTVMRVEEYAAYRTDRTRIGPVATVVPSPVPVANPSGDFQFDQVSQKAISDMSANEYDYFKMMREHELAQAETKIPQTTSIKRSVPVQDAGYPMPAASASDEQLRTFVDSIVEAGLAPFYLDYLAEKRNINDTEARVRRMIQRDPEWQDRQEDLAYVDRQARRALDRAFTYNPDQLKSDLGLRFDVSERLDYRDLVEQLHREYGDNLPTRDYDIMADVLGESGARAIRAILRDYNAWRFTAAK
jgi:hypothetical protein